MRSLYSMLMAMTALFAPLWVQANPAMPAGIDWVDIKKGGSVDAAFAQARRENRPLFLYWGAVWCPPCNQVKATVFSRQDFIERAKSFIPVYVDGDAPGAQQLGSRFKVSGYPTMILFRPDGTEVTRLPLEVDGAQYMRALTLAMNGGKPVKDLLAQANAGKPLNAAEWRQLAFYAWEVDELAVVPKAAERPATLWKLAQAAMSAAPDASARLSLKAVALAARDKGAPPFDKAAALQRVRTVLASPQLARVNLYEITAEAERLPPWLTEAGTPQRAQLMREWDRALTRMIDDGGLSRFDRLMAAGGRVGLARVDTPKGPLPVAIQTEVRGAVLSHARDVSDPYEREVVAVTAADVLADADLLADSDAVLKAQMERSATPYYHMLGLASNARKRGDNAAALTWAEKAYVAAQGPATRLQWGTHYLRMLVELAPGETERVERAAASVIGEIEPVPETFHGRNRNVFERLNTALANWNKDGRNEAALSRLRARRDAVCAQLPAQLPAQAPERATCQNLLKSAGA